MEPFKNFIDPNLVRQLAIGLKRVWPAFPEKDFVRQAEAGLADLELKDRVRHLAQALADTLPEDFSKAASILEASLCPAPKGDDPLSDDERKKGLGGWAVWPMTEYVARRGLPHFDRALSCLRELTQRASSEFAVRPFLAADPERALRILQGWLRDPSPHVRRWISEGTRPRLPWGERLQDFVRDPAPCLPLLEALYDDPSEYVRRSVANHLNDISKDHPDLAVGIARRWLADGKEQTRRLGSHALRGLIKKGHKDALALLGFSGGAKLQLNDFTVKPGKLSLGDTLTLTCTLTNKGRETANLVIDYSIHHQKADGSLRPKVFKGTKRKLKPGEKTEIQIRHPFKKVTVRRYHPGKHEVGLLANGRELARADFVLRDR